MRNTNALSEIAILVSLAVVLEVIFTGLSAFLPFMALPFGGRVSLSMLPLFVITYRHGIKYGVYAGLSYGILNLLLDAQLWHWGSLFLDYLFAFGVIGLGYVGVTLVGHNLKGFLLVIVFGSLFRFVFHYLSGVILFASYMPDTFNNVYFYSLVYNAWYIVPSMILILFVGYFIFPRIDNEELF